MRAVVFRGPQQPLQLSTWPTPVAARGQVLIEVRACGICGSDLHAAQNYGTPVDIVMGHELGGVVAAVGSADSRWCVGDRVAPLSQISCGECSACLAGCSSECTALEIIALNPRYNGGFAEYVLVGERDIVPIPEFVAFDDAALLEPLAVGLDAVRRARLGTDEATLIVGGGPIGQAIALWCRFFGATFVVVSEPSVLRRNIAMRLGATHAVDAAAPAQLAELYVAATQRQPTAVFEAVGMPGFIQRAIDVAAPRSRVVVAGACQSPETLLGMSATLKSLDLIFPFGYSVSDYTFIIECLQQRRIDPRPMISHRVSLDQLPAFFELLKLPYEASKVIVRPFGP